MVGASGIPPCAHTCSSALVAADNDVCVSMSMSNPALQGTGGLPMDGNLQFGVNPEDPPSGGPTTDAGGTPCLDYGRHDSAPASIME